VRRTTVRVTADCNNRCIFCAQAGAALDVEEDATSGDVTLVGGEPTLAADLRARIEGAAGRRVGLQTNAAQLDLGTLVAAGLTDLQLSIHGATADVHDYHTGVEGSFDRIEAVLPAPVPVLVTTVVTRSNFRVLADLPAFLAGRKVAQWVLAMPHVAGRAATGFDRVVGRLGMVMPYVLHAAERGETLGLDVGVAGAPLCALGPRSSLAVASRSRAFDPVCDGCPARPHCCGVDPAYLARFTAEELRPLHGPSAPARSMPRFVGAGPLHRIEVAGQDAPAHARKRLPVLGRPQAATTEVRGQPSRDARDLFPDLYDDD
jgi:hypothetical protein